MTLKTPLIEVKWGDVTYNYTQIRNVSISLSSDNKSNNCTVQLTSNVDIPPRGSPIAIRIYYNGSQYEFNASFTHVGTTYAVGNNQYLEIKGGSLLWNSANQTLQNKQYFTGSNTSSVTVKDFLIKFAKDKLKKEVDWQGTTTKSFVYVSQNGETDLQFFDRIAKSYGLQYKEDGNKLVIHDENTPVKSGANTGVNTPRVFYLDRGIIQDVIREVNPQQETSSESASTTDSSNSANSSNSPASESGTKADASVFLLSDNTKECGVKKYGELTVTQISESFPNIFNKGGGKAWAEKVGNAEWKNDTCLLYFAIQDVATQLKCSPVDFQAIGCFEGRWNTKITNSIGCVGTYQCCPPSYCTTTSKALVLNAGTVGQVYLAGYLLADTTNYQKVLKSNGGKIPLLNLYAGHLTGNYLDVTGSDGAVTPTSAVNSANFQRCLKEAGEYIKNPANGVNSSGTGTNSSTSGTTGTTGTKDALPFKCRLTVDMCPRLVGMKAGDMLVIPSNVYSGTEDFLIESVNYEKKGASFNLVISGGRPLTPEKIAQEEVYSFIKKIDTLKKYLEYLWGK